MAPTALGNLPGTVLAELAKLDKRVATLEQQILSSSSEMHLNGSIHRWIQLNTQNYS